MSGGELRFSLAERKPGSINTTGSSGNEVQISNLEEFNDAIRNVHNENNQTNWILVGYDGQPDKIKLLSTGTHGINELVNHFDDSEMTYAIVRVVDVIDNIPTNRYVYITFIGDNVKAITKAKYGTNKTSITKLLGHYNVEIIASNKSEVSETEIMGKIQDASGSRNRTAIQKVKNPSDSVNWMLIGYENKEELGLVGTGSGGLQELVSVLNSSANKVLYGIVSTFDKFDEIAQANIKIAQITFVGVSVSPLVKGRLTTHRGTIDELFSPVHVSLFSESPSSDLTDDILASKIQQLKGNRN
ncbi:hypothetical protein DICPUDRAFT_88560 [Dictyostelium purpureum]|uniref:Coactosin n=1 Tax=Dictyostelium purpureum TaxID=5786 RepID=F0ZQ44_DICPU|nr:uncharacterized protein DICPUDRAFT_88560 [Dictyostelium purpureum]EGC33945.1 hypothetical protein DICPUDRAFT_88560 [Dictyostelium purpureum]|eukprot:XP_003289527.1 hypothetical protein DICPUDRAFT_88560 [Dictyostelium purpureum]